MDQLKNNARNLRKNMTKEERHPWYEYLKDHPVRIRRQNVIGPYIVDFYCASAALVIELDGSQHFEEDGLEKDKIRDRTLSEQGILVKRYSNADINQRFQAVCEDIYETVQKRKRSHPNKPSP